jgi:putative addiction module component (TIGR02574 family)
MSERAEALLNEVLSLPERERDELVGRLLERLDPPSDIDQMTEDEFLAELHRREVEMRDDPTSRVPWEQVREMR